MPAEGVIQFAYELTDGAVPEDFAHRAELTAWRSILRQLDLVGQDPSRYEGFAYGNVSVRVKDGEFIITASQTSGENELLDEHLVHITACNIERFWVDAVGAEPPSSESVTHAMVYAADQRVNCVLHIHNPEIWQASETLKLPSTPAEVQYGTTAMASAVAQLLATYQSRPMVFTTLGHEDGVFACGHSPRDCGAALVNTLARARAL